MQQRLEAVTLQMIGRDGCVHEEYSLILGKLTSLKSQMTSIKQQKLPSAVTCCSQKILSIKTDLTRFLIAKTFWNSCCE